MQGRNHNGENQRDRSTDSAHKTTARYGRHFSYACSASLSGALAIAARQNSSAAIVGSPKAFEVPVKEPVVSVHVAETLEFGPGERWPSAGGWETLSRAPEAKELAGVWCRLDQEGRPGEASPSVAFQVLSRHEHGAPVRETKNESGPLVFRLLDFDGVEYREDSACVTPPARSIRTCARNAAPPVQRREATERTTPNTTVGATHQASCSTHRRRAASGA